jgi:hypothetical protein
MPRGVPKSGFRMTNKRKAVSKVLTKDIIEQHAPVVILQNETDDEIAARLDERFDILQTMTNAAILGDARALIVSGPAGLGKSFTVEKELEAWDSNGDNHTIVKGYVRTTGLYKLLYQHREANKVLVFDDADSIFYDDASLNLLKAVCDTTEKRVVSYLAETNMVDEESAERIPRSFVFNGTIIFITNLDFDALIDRGHKLAPHLQALVSRSHYMDLAMKTRRDYLVRIKQVIRHGLLKDLTDEQKTDVMNFITQNSDRLRELSLRVALKIGSIRRLNKNWEKMARVTCCKG